MIANPPVEALQRRLSIAVEIIAPLKSIDAARSDLSTDEDDIIFLIRDKQLLAFDFRTEGANRSEIRIFPPSINAVRAHRLTASAQPDWSETSDADLLKIISQIISSNRPSIPLSIFRRRLVISSKHAHALLAQHAVTAVPGTGNTINQAPMIVRATIVEFLKERRIGHLS